MADEEKNHDEELTHEEWLAAERARLEEGFTYEPQPSSAPAKPGTGDEILAGALSVPEVELYSHPGSNVVGHHERLMLGNDTHDVTDQEITTAMLLLPSVDRESDVETVL